MTKNTKIESKVKLPSVIILIIGGIGCSFIGYYLSSKSLENEYPQIDLLVLGVFFSIFGLFCLIAILNLQKFEFDGEKLIVKSIFNTTKKIIYSKDIISYSEIEKGDDYRWKDLTIFTASQKQKIASSSISNYYFLKSALTDGKTRNESFEKLDSFKSEKWFGIGFTIIGLLFIFGMLHIYNKDNKIESNQLFTIQGSIKNALEIDRNTNSDWINIKLKEYPKFTFEIVGNRYYAAQTTEIVAEILQNDKVEIDIFTDTYEKKILKTKELTFLDKTVNYNQILVNGLRKNNKTYLDYISINQEYKSDLTNWGWWFFFLFGIGFVILGIGCSIKHKNFTVRRSMC